MKKPFRLSRVLLFQSAGFAVIAAMIWLDPVLELVSRSLNHPGMGSIEVLSPTLKTFLVLTVWFLITTATRRILVQLQSLEGFMRVCSWCRRIDYKGHWVPFEEFLEQGFDTPTTHGICGQCLEEQRQASRKHRDDNARIAN